jgi:hypothetical protein
MSLEAEQIARSSALTARADVLRATDRIRTGDILDHNQVL